MAAIWPDCCFAEQIAGPADFQIRCGDSETRAQLRKLLNRHQSFLCVFREAAFIGDQEDRRRPVRRYGPRARAADTSCARPNMSARLTMIVLAWSARRCPTE